MILIILFNLLFFTCQIFPCQNIAQENFSSNKIEKFNFKEIQIKVLLDEMYPDDQNSWKISSTNGLILTNHLQKKFYKNPLTIKFDKTNFYLNNKLIEDPIIQIRPANGLLRFNNNEYDGSFYLIQEKDSLLLINEVELEEYIFSVLFTESFASWPLEVNKAFAIACRSYVIAKLLENRKTIKNKLPYHIKNNNKHQTYCGVHKAENLRAAVDETRGLILGYNKQPILAMYDICCGGIIPAHIKHVNFKNAPYLARKKQCTFCSKCKLYNWQTQFARYEFENVLRNEFPKLGTIKEINVIKDKAGVTQKIEIKDKKSIFKLTGKKFYSLFRNTKSFCFSIFKKTEKIIIKGNGYGHHLGICQWGTRELVNRGWDFQSILKFYYPGTKFMRLQNK